MPRCSAVAEKDGTTFSCRLNDGHWGDHANWGRTRTKITWENKERPEAKVPEVSEVVQVGE